MKFIKSFFRRLFTEIKQVGWFWGICSLLLAGIIFYAPSIFGFIMYAITTNNLYLTIAIGYATWWFLPAFSPGLLVYFSILGLILKIIRTIQRKGENNDKIL